MTKPKDKQKSVGRYRKVEVRIWGDEKFRSLTPIAPSGQGLFLYMITGPHTGPIPGLFSAGRAALAEALNWEQEAFDKAFGEAFREGLVEADWRARVVWVPKAIKHNKPESPNVVTGWAGEFDLIPECALKWQAREALKASVHALGEAYGNAFDKAIGKPSGKTIGKTTGNQEQEQEQEINTPPPPKGGKKRSKPAIVEPAGFVAWWELWPRNKRKEARGKCAEMWVQEGFELIATTILAHVTAKLNHTDWAHEGAKYVEAPIVYLGNRRWEGAELADFDSTPTDWTAGAI